MNRSIFINSNFDAKLYITYYVIIKSTPSIHELILCPIQSGFTFVDTNLFFVELKAARKTLNDSLQKLYTDPNGGLLGEKAKKYFEIVNSIQIDVGEQVRTTSYLPNNVISHIDINPPQITKILT